MPHVLIELKAAPDKTKLVPESHARALVRLGRWQYQTTALDGGPPPRDEPEAEKPARRAKDNPAKLEPEPEPEVPEAKSARKPARAKPSQREKPSKPAKAKAVKAVRRRPGKK